MPPPMSPLPLFSPHCSLTFFSPNAEESNAEESNAEESNAEESNAEESNAEESNAEESNAEESNAEESSLWKLRNFFPVLFQAIWWLFFAVWPSVFFVAPV